MLRMLMVTLVMLTFVSASANARSGDDVLTCVFTEPFFTVVLEEATGKVKLSSPEHFDEVTDTFRDEVIATGAELILDPNFSLAYKEGSEGYVTFIVVDGQGQNILELKLTGEGTDGMSDKFYPFEGTYVGPRFNLQGHIGGCGTKVLPAR